MKQPQLARVLIYSVAALLLAAAVSSCKSSQSFAVAKFEATADSSGLTAPGVLARWDGDLFVGWASTYAKCSVEPKGGGLPFYHVTLPAGRMLVYQRSDSFKWSSEFPSPLPPRAAALFTQAEVTQWGLSFADTAPVAAPTP